MRSEKTRVVVCRDAALRGYLQRMPEQCGEPEVCPPPADGADATLVADGGLTRREVECLQAMADCGEVGAAARLGISPRTLNNELAQIRAKLGVKATLSAVLWAMRVGGAITDATDLPHNLLH